MTTPRNPTGVRVPKASTALFSVKALLLALLAAVLLGLLALWWLGLGLESGKAVAASLTTILVFVTLGEFLRRRCRITLKAFFALFTIVAVVIGVFAQRVTNARRQSVVVSRIHELGGVVYYNYDHESDDWLVTNGGIVVPTWVRRLFGDGMFAHVTFVSLDGSQYQDSDLVGFDHGLRSLEGIHLSKTNVTDRGVKELTNLLNLRTVMVNGDQATPDGVESLAKLPSLEELVLFGPRVTDDTLLHLKRLPRLRRLTLWDTNVTDRGLRHLPALDELEFLNLNSRQIGDEGVIHVASIPNLHELHLERTAVSDVGIILLKDSQKMKRISLFRNSVTELGTNKLRAAMPGVDIRR